MSIIQRYGLISGLMWANFPFILHYSGAGDQKNFFFLPVLALFIFFLYMGIRQRKAQLRGYLDQRDGIRVGLGISLIAGLMCGVGVFILYKYVDVEFLQQAREQLTKAAPEKFPDLSPEERAEKVNEVVSRLPLTFAFQTSSILIFAGGIASVIIALIMRSSKTTEA